MTAAIGRTLERPARSKPKQGSVSIPIYFEKYEGISRIFQDCINSANSPLLPTVTVFAEGTRVRVCFANRRLKESVFRTGDSPEDALEAINTAIMAGNADWRPQKAWRPK